MLFVVIALLAYQVTSRPDVTAAERVKSSELEPAASVTTGETNNAQDNASEQTYISRLAPGIMSAAPKLSEVPAIEKIPWLPSEIMDVYNQADASACQMLPPGQAVQTSLELLGTSESMGGGRMAALTIRLEVDENEKSKLPSSTKSSILAYLRDHEIAIEPALYVDANGKLYFGGDCRAAFYEVARPEITVAPEPMVQEAIGRIRTLGVLRSQETDQARTLVLAIRYAKTADGPVKPSHAARYETELLFFHLPADATLESPRLSVFISSEGRVNLHRLDRMIQGQVNGTALLTAMIRFDSFVLMGVYPASPVVTGVMPHRSVQMPIEPLVRLTEVRPDGSSLSFQSVLDQYAMNDDVSALVRVLSQTRSLK